jgi:hypothetical protein
MAMHMSAVSAFNAFGRSKIKIPNAPRCSARTNSLITQSPQSQSLIQITAAGRIGNSRPDDYTGNIPYL